MELQQYLARIGIAKIKSPSIDFLMELQNQHLLSIPFEDLDIPERDRIILDIERIYKKIIPTKRGGFCYELNGLFHWLLTELGYKVDMLSARVYNNSKNELGPEFDHMTLLVHLDKNFLVDVGFGDSFRKPIEFSNGKVEDISGQYRMVYAKDNYELQRKENRGWALQYTFNLTPRKLSDFNKMCNFQQDSPTSHFRTTMKCTIATRTGRITVSNSSLTITENGKKTKTEVKNTDEFYRLIKKFFQIELS
ncbi:MAG: arylamine N-acetyltransferase [Melioribacter sp.]|nr:arylamine N-acetyltransferase [Melioribacter sp.]